MRELKRQRIEENVNKWLSGQNYSYGICEIQGGYQQVLNQGNHRRKTTITRKETFDSGYVKSIKKFIFEIMEHDFTEAVFGKVIEVRIPFQSVSGDIMEYLRPKNYLVIGIESVGIADCWMVKIIDEGLPLTEEMTLV
jgi:hypothetical protein